MKDIYGQKKKMAQHLSKYSKGAVGKAMNHPMASQGGVGRKGEMKTPQAHHGKFWDTKGMKYRQS